MNYLVDTRYLIWSLICPERIADQHVGILEDYQHTKYASSISFWEISLKYSLGKLRLEDVTPEGLVEAARDAGFAVLGISDEQLASAHRLERVGGHRDPFDRLLVWQCLRQDYLMLTADPEIRQYSAVGLRLG